MEETLIYARLSRGKASQIQVGDIYRQHAWRESTTKCYNGSPWGKNTDSLPKLLRYSDASLVDPAFYRDIVSTCVKASLAPAFNIMEMATLQKRYSEHWTLCSCWLSE